MLDASSACRGRGIELKTYSLKFARRPRSGLAAPIHLPCGVRQMRLARVPIHSVSCNPGPLHSKQPWIFPPGTVMVTRRDPIASLRVWIGRLGASSFAVAAGAQTVRARGAANRA